MIVPSRQPLADLTCLDRYFLTTTLPESEKWGSSQNILDTSSAPHNIFLRLFWIYMYTRGCNIYINLLDFCISYSLQLNCRQNHLVWITGWIAWKVAVIPSISNYLNDPNFFWPYRSGQTVKTQIRPRGAVWSGSTLYAILSAPFGHIIIWWSHVFKF